MPIPASISVYEHAAALIGHRPYEVSRDPDLLLAAHRTAYELYHHFPVVVGIDIYNLEAEAYGCEVCEPEENGIPAVVDPLFANLDEALGIEPFDPERAGRIPMVLAVAARLQREFPRADIRVPVSGPFSIAQSLLGLNGLMEAVALAPGRVRAFLHRLVPGQVAFSRAARNAGIKAAFFESAAAPPLLSPAQFREIELPPLREAMAGVAEVMGQPVPCIIGGDTRVIVPEMMATGTNFVICPAETDREGFLARMAGYPSVTVRVNLSPSLYTTGSKEDIAREIDAVIDLAARSSNRVLLGTGAIPYETSPENILFLLKYASGEGR